MKKRLLSLLLGCLSVLWLQAQSDLSQERRALMFEYANSMYDLLREGEVDTAVARSQILAREYPSLLISGLHDSRMQVFVEWGEEDVKLKPHYRPTLAYFDQLAALAEPRVDSVLFALYAYREIYRGEPWSQQAPVVTDLLARLGPQPNWPARAERYALLMVKYLDRHGAGDQPLRDSLLQRTLQSLRTPWPEGEDRGSASRRAWQRYLLAWANFYQSQQPGLSLAQQDSFLRRAAALSPDAQDQQVNNAYFYDAVVMQDTLTSEIGFVNAYVDFLRAQGRSAEALEWIAQQKLTAPTDLAQLRELFLQVYPDSSFAAYWAAQVAAFAQPLPPEKLTDLSGEAIDLASFRNQWLYVDVWGTWCAPCIRELPDLQHFYQTQQTAENPVQVLTLSYQSTELADFMQKNGYTFPVVEVPRAVIDALPIQGFPTKILITPDQQMIVIPFGTDWQAYIDGYRGQDL